MYTTSVLTAQSPNGLGYSTAGSLFEGCLLKESSLSLGFPIQRKIPIKIILNDDEEVASNENHSETTEENSLYRFSPFSAVTSQSNLRSVPAMHSKKSTIFHPSSSCNKVVYIFNILKSRKKEKKYLRKKFNKVISRVHNMDCLLKKIKAKFLKFLFLNIKKDLKELQIDIKKFDQCKEVRNLNVPHNRDKFINLTVLEVLMNNQIIDQQDCRLIFTSDNLRLKDFLTTKIKHQYQFEFLKSSYFRNWLKDPIKIESNEKSNNKNCEKFPNHSKNIFKTNFENYERYKKLLLHTACNFLFYFQNNPLKFGKKQRD